MCLRHAWIRGPWHCPKDGFNTTCRIPLRSPLRVSRQVQSDLDSSLPGRSRNGLCEGTIVPEGNPVISAESAPPAKRLSSGFPAKCHDKKCSTPTLAPALEVDPFSEPSALCRRSLISALCRRSLICSLEVSCCTRCNRMKHF